MKSFFQQPVDGAPRAIFRPGQDLTFIVPVRLGGLAVALLSCADTSVLSLTDAARGGGAAHGSTGSGGDRIGAIMTTHKRFTARVPWVRFNSPPSRLVRMLVHIRFAAPLAAMALALLSPPAGATPICRWVDENGRTQIADVVPDKYRQVATCTDSQKYELSPEQRRAAEQRVADDRARARNEAAKPPGERASSAPRPAGSAPLPGAKRPAEVVTDATDCRTWWRIYDESVECFGPYRTTRGATKVEAFDACNVVPSPEARCGPRSN